MSKSTTYRIKDPLLRWVWAGGLFLLPFIWNPEAAVHYELPRVWFFQRWVEVLVLGAIWTGIPNIKFDRPLVMSVLGWLVVGAVSSVLGVDVTKSVWGNYWRGDGLLTLVHVIALVFLVGIYWKKGWEKSTLLALRVSIWLFVGWWGVSQVVQGWHIEGLAFGQPVYLMGWMLVAVTILVTHVHLLEAAIVILTTGVMAGINHAEAVVGLVGLCAGLRWKRLLPFIVVGGAVVGIVWWQTKQTILYRGPEGTVYESRERIIRKVVGGALQRPLLGWGWSNVDYAFKAYDWPIPVPKDVYVDKAHSSLVEAFATTGILGLGIYVFLLARTGWKLRKSVWMLPFVILVLHMQTNVVGIAEEMWLWVMVGVAQTF